MEMGHQYEGHFGYTIKYYDRTLGATTRHFRCESQIFCAEILILQTLISLTTGHPKIRGFFTHGGLLSLLETVYHGVPIVVMPIYYDQDANGAAAVANGFGVVIQIQGLTSEKLHKALSTVVHDPKYRSEAK
jgi:UDP:flavonoid glycosyltransferase YjiC (YdhE family)